MRQCHLARIDEMLISGRPDSKIDCMHPYELIDPCNLPEWQHSSEVRSENRRNKANYGRPGRPRGERRVVAKRTQWYSGKSRSIRQPGSRSLPAMVKRRNEADGILDKVCGLNKTIRNC